MTFEEWVAKEGWDSGANLFCAEQAWKAATLVEREACAKLCEDIVYPIPIDQFSQMTKKEHSAYACHQCAKEIRARSI